MPRLLSSAAIFTFALLSACASVDLTRVAPTVVSENASRGIAPCTNSVSIRLTEEIGTVTQQRIEALGALPPQLSKDRVIVQLTNAVIYQVASGRLAALKALGGRAADAGVLKSLEPVGRLSNSDFKRFAQTLAATALNPVVADGEGAAKDSGPTLVDYYNTYYKNEFYDRFGVAIAKPKNIQNISDDDIAGAVSIALEYILDQLVKTPVWEDTNKNYYPGNFKNEPSVLALHGIAGTTKLLDESQSMKCGITPLKAQAIAYLSNAAGDRAAMLGGLTTGSFGGLHFGLGVLGKWSIGDNQTLQVIVKTALSRTFSRGAEELSYEVLENIGYKGKTISDLLQYVIEHGKT